MISTDFTQVMAAYNKWQNDSIYGAADKLSDPVRRKHRGAFFGSIHQTLCHILWADQLWLSRFGDFDPPAPLSITDSVNMEEDWNALKGARQITDQIIINWSLGLEQSDFGGDLTWWSGAMNAEISKPYSLLIVHFFNHQTHHRGQAHAMLTAAGATPDDTDIPFMPG